MQYSRRQIAHLLSSGFVTSILVGRSSAQTARVRPNIASLTQPKIDLLKAGVAEMKRISSVDRDDPKGWYFWSASHGTQDVIPDSRKNFYYKCQHGTPHFVSWHRAFLLFFESALRDAARDATGDASLDLPYWDWYRQRKIPAAFTEGTAATNPLWHDRVNDTVGRLSTAAFTQKNLLGTSEGRGFSSVLEGDPHATVHGDIGGDMGFIGRSARDPLFWLHHANVDRLWARWQVDGGQSPGSSWDAERFSFNPNGQMVQRAGDLSPTDSLGYVYESLDVPGLSPVTIAAAAVVVAVTPSNEKNSPQALEGEAGSVLLSRSEDIVVGSDGLVLVFPVRGVDAKGLKPFAAGTKENGAYTSVKIVLEDVRLGKDGANGGFSFDACINLPQVPSDADYASRCRATLNSFTIGGQDASGDHHGHGGTRIVLPVAPEFFSDEKGRQQIGTISLQLVASGAATKADGEYLSIGRATLSASTLPGE